jgi:hypothetical protein
VTLATVDATALENAEGAVGLAALFQLFALLAAAVFFLRWFHRAYASLSELGETSLRFTPGWAVGGFFVPVLGLVRPYQVMQELWQRGARRWKQNASLVAGHARPRNVVGVWWASFLATSIFGNAAARLFDRAEEPLEIASAARIDMASTALDLAAAAIAIVLVGSVTQLLAPLLRGTTIQVSSTRG